MTGEQFNPPKPPPSSIEADRIRWVTTWVPALTAAFVFGVFGFILFFIVPKFEAIFADFGTSLPVPTLMVIHASRIMRHGWPLTVPAAAILATGLWLLLRRLSRTSIGLFVLLALLLVGGGVAFIVIALFVPLVGTIQTMRNQG